MKVLRLYIDDAYLGMIVAHYKDFKEELISHCYPMISASFIHKTDNRSFSDPVLDSVERKMYLEKIICSIDYAVDKTHEDISPEVWLNFLIDICNGKAPKDINDSAKRRLGRFFVILDRKLHST